MPAEQPVVGFRIYYTDGSVFDSGGRDLREAWLAAPSDEVQAVRLALRGGGHFCNQGYDFYWMLEDAEGRLVFPADGLVGGIVMERATRLGHSFLPPDDYPGLKRSGKQMTDAAFQALLARAKSEE